MSDATQPSHGLRLSRDFYFEIVRPFIHQLVETKPHSAALIGFGSEVLGYDDVRSTDHNWGPRVRIFFDDESTKNSFDELRAQIAERLPEKFSGYPTAFDVDSVEVFDLREYVDTFLGFDPRTGVKLRDWLSTPSQLLLEVTEGEVFHDGLGQLEGIRSALEWYPHDTWLYLIACQWKRISQEEAFVGRTFEVGDEMGSRLVIARLVRDLTRLCFLFERKYAPYSKWLGSSFQKLSSHDLLAPLFEQALSAETHEDREMALAKCYESAGQIHNELRVTKAVDPSPRTFHSRPFQVLHAERFVEATMEAVTDEEILSLPRHVGSVDQFVDSTDVLGSARRARLVSAFYESS